MKRVLAALLLAIAATAIAACAEPEPTEPAAPTPPVDAIPRDQATPLAEDLRDRKAEVAPAPEPRPWEPTANEVEVELKTAAADVALEVTTFDGDADPAEIAAAVADAEPADAAAVARALEPLVPDERASAGEVIYPIFGGLTDDAASLMVVVRLHRYDPADPGEVDEETRTLDLRFERTGGTWRFTEFASAGGTPIPRPEDLEPAAEAVLDDERIDLPDSARWDIHSGEVSTVLLESMAALAERTSYRVGVIAAGHPEHVFETDRVSNHTRGRAVDIFEIGGMLVVEGRDEGSPIYEAARWLYDDLEVTELGSPWAFDGRGGRSFTDRVHADHIHLGHR